MRKSSLRDDVGPDEKHGQVKVILCSTPAFQERATTSGRLDKNRVDRCRHALSPATCRAQGSTSPPCVFSGRSKVGQCLVTDQRMGGGPIVPRLAVADPAQVPPWGASAQGG